MDNEQAASDSNSGIIQVEIEEEAVEKLRVVANDNSVPLDRMIQQAISHGLTLMGSDASRDSKETTPTFE
jgi:PIN domain nuclease of toxin-antitoxin system